MDRNNATVLVVGSGRQVYREYLMRGLAERADLWLLGERPPTWEAAHIAGSTTCAPLDHQRPVPDQAALLDAAFSVAADRKVTGVVTYDEVFVLAAARLAEALGVPGIGVAGALNCRDKRRSREALSAAGLPQPGFAFAATLADAGRAARGLGYPVVLKPRGMGASIGVVKVTAPSELAAAFDITEQACRAGPPDFEDGILVEELVEGPEVSVDAVLSGGVYRPFCVARKRLGHPPFFEETGHLVDARDPLAADPRLRQLLATAHEALGVADGITHTEVRLTSRGPVVIEVNARLGGDLIPYLGMLATGVNPGRIAADAATGAEPDLVPRVRRCAGIRFLYPPQDCRVTDVSLAGARAVPGVHTARAMAEPGDVLRLPPRAHLGRYGYLVAVGNGPAACERTLDEASALARLVYEPQAADGHCRDSAATEENT